MSSLVLLAAAALAAQDPGIRIRASHFTVEDTRRGGVGTLETVIVPLRPGTSCYNWTIEVEPEERTVQVREVFELPAPAAQWGMDPTVIQAIRRDNRVAVTQIEDSLADGLITHGWCVAEGDPLGAHVIRVYLGDTMIRDFHFEVVPETY